MALPIKRATDPVDVNGLKLLIYGQPGVRKTSWSFTAPKTILFDCDGGIRRVGPAHRGDYLPIKKWEEVTTYLADPEILAYDTFVFDTVGKLLNFCADYCIRTNPSANKMKTSAALSQKGYGALASEMRSFMGGLVAKGKNLIFIAHGKESKDGDVTEIRPDITGQTLGMLTSEMDFVGYARVSNNRSSVSFTPGDGFYGKNSAQLPDPLFMDEWTVAKIFETYRAQVNDQAAIHEQYNFQLSQVKGILSQVETVDEMNAVMANIAEINFVLDGKLQAFNLCKAHAATIGCAFDNKAKTWVPTAPAKEEAPAEAEAATA